jgi:hypothetical protein
MQIIKKKKNFFTRLFNSNKDELKNIKSKEKEKEQIIIALVLLNCLAS